MRRAWIARLVALALPLAGCMDSEEQLALPHEDAEDSVVLARRRYFDTANAALQPGQLRTVAAARAYIWKGPGGRPFEVAIRTDDPAAAHARPFGTITLSNSLRPRSANVGQYPCSSCHVGRRVEMRDDRIVDAHRNIQPRHPALTGATCATCHARDNVELLALKSGERASLDHTYRLCAQCHFRQAESWANGAHGKRLDGWQGRRVLMGCADCHDPHNPGIEKRIPFRAPQIERVRKDK